MTVGTVPHRPERFEHGAQHGVGDGGAQRPDEQLAVVAELVARPSAGAALESGSAQAGSAQMAATARRPARARAAAGAGRPAAAQLLQEAVVLRVQARPRVLACKQPRRSEWRKLLTRSAPDFGCYAWQATRSY